MTRQEFIRFLAALGCGRSPLQESLQAYVTLFERNTLTDAQTDLIFIEDIYVAGMASSALPLEVLFQIGPTTLPLGFNAFGGVVRWVSPIEMPLPIVARADVRWHTTVNITLHALEKILGRPVDRDDLDAYAREMLNRTQPSGFIRCINQRGVTETRLITTWDGDIVEAPSANDHGLVH